MMIDQINISRSKKELIQNSINNYRRFARVQITIDKVVEEKVFVTVEQSHLVGRKILTDQELRTRTKKVFANTGILLYIKSIPIAGASSPEYTR